MGRVLIVSAVLAFSHLALGADWEPGGQVQAPSDVRWIRGEPVHRFETGRVYVLEFWSTWCGACADSIDGLNELARRFEKDVEFVAIHIWQKESAPNPVEFLEKRLNTEKAIMSFAVAEDVNGETSRAWMDATVSTGLPTVMIVDRTSTLVWIGHPRELHEPLEEIVKGTFDVSRRLAEMKLRIHVSRLANDSDAAIRNGEYQRGIHLILDALESDPNTVSDWIPSTYGHLLATSRSPNIARRFTQSVLATEAGRRPDLLAGLATAIFHFRPLELRDLEFALSLATRADALSIDRDAALLSLIAAIRNELGDVSGAITALETAIQNTGDGEARLRLAQKLSNLKSCSGD